MGVNLSHRFIIGDTRAVMAAMPDASVDLVLCSPPFLALRSYLSADHPDKALEIGSEATPADFLDTLLDIAEEARRVLTPHGSLVFELGDTFSGSGGAGGDYADGGLRDGQERFDGSKSRAYGTGAAPRPARANRGGLNGRASMIEKATGGHHMGGAGWPMDKSLTFIPELFGASLAYGRNLLRPERTTEPWRIRNLIAWCRPNPPVGALGDKCRPATSYLTVATVSRTRWWDMDAVRTEAIDQRVRTTNGRKNREGDASEVQTANYTARVPSNPAGAPLLDYWEIPTQPYKGSHYATWPEEIARRCILLMCPEKVCTACGEPSRRIVETTNALGVAAGRRSWRNDPTGIGAGHSGEITTSISTAPTAERVTTGWTDCGHDAWRPGIVLDPFAGSGTTLRMALGNGRSAIGIDLDERNADLARERVGPLYLTVEHFGREEVPA